MRRVLVLRATTAALVAAFASTTIAAAAGIKWTAFEPPHRSGRTVTAFAARSSSDAWAVGLKPSFGLCQYATLAEHWDGAAWTVVDSPSDPKTNYVFDSVAVVGKNEAWAVGSFGCPDRQGNAHSSTLTEHWDGRSWSVVHSPNGGPTGTWFSGLHSVTAITTDNVWAAGLTIKPSSDPTKPGTAYPLIEHRDGKRWSIVAAPKGALGGLESISSTSASDVWAVGGTEISPVTTLALHFDGSSWSRLPLPTVPNTTAAFFSVKATSRNDAWAVGKWFPTSGNGQILIDHWDGKSWTVVKNLPTVGPTGSETHLFSVDAASGTGVWAVGGWSSDAGANAIAIHWTGTAWVQAPAPATNEFFALAVLPNNELFTSDVGTIFLGQVS